MMTDLQQKRLALAAMQAGYIAFEHPQGYMSGKTHFVVRTPKGNQFGDTALAALATAAEVNGLTPADVVPMPMHMVDVVQSALLSLEIDLRKAAKSWIRKGAPAGAKPCEERAEVIATYRQELAAVMTGEKEAG